MKLYIGNLPFSATEETLKSAFSEFGDITEANIIIDKFTRKSKGFGFLTFSNEDSGKQAIAKMDGKEFEGRALKVSEAKPMEESDRPRRSFGGDRPRSFGGRSNDRPNNRRRF